MAQVKLKILQNGQPLVGAEVTVGDKWNGTTDAQGRFQGTIPPGLARRMVMPIVIEKLSGLQYGSTVKFEEDKETVIEV